MTRPGPRRAVPAALALALAALLALLAAVPAPARPTVAPMLPLRVVRELPHDPEAYTEGLFLRAGRLYESTGRWGASGLRITDPATGRMLRRADLPEDRFGEGIALVRSPGPEVVMLTWKSGQGFVFDADTLALKRTFEFEPEGWGLAADPGPGADLAAPGAGDAAAGGDAAEPPAPRALWQTRGDNVLLRRDPHDLAVVAEVPVYDGLAPVGQLNELEIVGDTAVVNVWLKDRLAVVRLRGPEAGRVVAWVDLAPLRRRLGDEAEEANGVAWDPATGHLLVTGKFWDKLFEIDVQPRPW